MSLDSAEESDINFNFDEQPEKLREEIQNIKFPDKIIMKQFTLNKRNTDLPRLDMSRVYQKYQSQNNVHVVKPVKKASQSQSKISLGISKKLLKNSVVSQNAQSKINNAKNELIQTKDVIRNLENVVEEAKKAFKDNKTRHVKIKENVKIADAKIEHLKNQIRMCTYKDISDDVVNLFFFIFIKV
jgi:hypothetical protein